MSRPPPSCETHVEKRAAAVALDNTSEHPSVLWATCYRRVLVSSPLVVRSSAFMRVASRPCTAAAVVLLSRRRRRPVLIRLLLAALASQSPPLPTHVRVAMQRDPGEFLQVRFAAHSEYIIMIINDKFVYECEVRLINDDDERMQPTKFVGIKILTQWVCRRWYLRYSSLRNDNQRERYVVKKNHIVWINTNRTLSAVVIYLQNKIPAKRYRNVIFKAYHVMYVIWYKCMRRCNLFIILTDKWNK